jgi:hypothetical protein
MLISTLISLISHGWDYFGTAGWVARQRRASRGDCAPHY